ncbi:non-ribosomal peptide synthetase [Actinophytocola xinjiangensis]|nr:non-ribosomal peptide synthetase [Actinophytocola xinjiangensis]
MTNVLEQSQAAHAHPAQVAFWRGEIAALGAPTRLPRDYLHAQAPRPVRTATAALDAATLAAVGRITHDDPVLVRVLYAAVLAVLAARATDRDRVAVVLPVSGQAVAVALDVPRAAPFRALLAATRDAVGRASANLDVPVGHLFGQAGAAPTDLALTVGADLDPVALEPFGCVLRVDVTTRVAVAYRADLFTAATAGDLALAYADLLAEVAADPAVPLARLLDAGPRDRARLAAFNDTAAALPDDGPLHRFLERRAAAEPDRVAVAGLTYGEVDRRANRLAARLRGLGVRRGDVVGVGLPRGRDAVVAVHAVLKAGAAFLPIDPALPPARITRLLTGGGATVVLGAPLVPGVATWVDVPTDGDLSTVDDGAGPDDACYLIHTSGSTGHPKGVLVSHRAIVNRIAWMQRAYPLGAQDVVLHKTPCGFDVSVWELFWWALAGASVCTVAPGDERDPERIVAAIARHRVTTVHFVPSMLGAFLRYVEATGTAGSLRSLRTVFASGEALTGAHVEAARRLLGDTALVNLYGPTEAAIDVTHFDCAGADPRRPVPIGRPIANTALHVRTRAGGLAPVGTPGELSISGTGLAIGYRDDPARTATAFVPDPAGRAYRTGDLARWLPDGTLEFLGRLDGQLKLRGQRIEPGEIEHVARQDATVADCAVTVVAGALCAYVVVTNGFDERRLAARFAAELPAGLVPAFVLPVPGFPVGPTGKRDLSGLPAPAGPAGHVAPRTPEETSLAAIWARALRRERVGVRDNFFALGGDSITFIGVLAAAREAGFDFTFQDLFATPTVEQLAGRRGGARSGRRTGPFALLDPADRDRLPAGAVDAYPLSALQAGLLYETARRGPGLYHDVASYRLPEPVRVDAFRAAVAAVVDHHPALRTSFHTGGYTEPIQVVHRRIADPLVVEPLTAEALAGFHDAELAAGFTPGATDLVRFRLFVSAHRAHYGISYHAAALDGWSVSLVNRDVFAAYAAILRGERPVFTTPSVSVADFVALERADAGSGERREFWAAHLDGAHGTRLPRPDRPAGTPPGVAVHDVPVPEELSAALRRVAAELAVPVKSVLLAAHVAVLAVVSGSDDVLTGYEHSGRPEEHGGEHLAGLFLNTLPLRVRVPGGTWAELVRAVYRAETDLLPHRRFPLSAVTRALGERAPAIEAVFNFTHFHALRDLGFDLVRTAITSRTEFPLRAEFWQDPFTDHIGLSVHHDPAEFGRAQIDRIAGYYRRALELLTTHTGEDHRAHPLLSPAELATLTDRFAGPARPLPAGTALDLIAEQVRTRPDALALVADGQRLDYRTLDRRGGDLAGHLAAEGVRPGDVVAVALDRGLPWALTVLALLRLGAVYLPLDPADPPARLAAMVRHAGCRHVVATGDVGDLPATVLRPEDVRPAPEPAHRPAAGDLAYVIFTSGSTGEPKGALIRHLGLLNHLLAKVTDLGLGPDAVVAQTATQCFDISVWQLLVAWLAGGTTVVYGRDVVADPPALLDALAADAVTVVEVVPPHLDALLTEVEHRPRPLPALRHALVTGETLPPALTRRWFARYPVPLVNAYGPTEASDDVTHHVLRGAAGGERVPVGTPVLNTHLYVVAGDGRLAPLGTYGEVCVTGPGVGAGYVNDPRRTAIAFRPNGFDDTSALLYRTGDLGRWLPGGVLDCAGRVDQQVKIRGHRVELSEIEGALAGLAGIDHAVALVTGGRLVAHCTGPAVPAAAEVRAALAATLPRHMLPDVVAPCAAFPVNRNGKVDRDALARRALPEPDHRREPPAGETETRLLALFAEVLRREPGEIGVTDNFFAVGGHSLAAMRLASRLDTGVRDVLDHPTVRSLAARIGTAGRAPLVDLTAAAGRRLTAPALTLVCVPAAGGDPVGYLPLARAAGPAVRVLAVDPAAREPAQRLAAALPEGPVVLLGHSAGAGPALAIAFARERLGRRVAHLVVAGTVLTSLDPGDHTDGPEPTDDQVRQWLVRTAGLARADLVDPAAFRHDSALARRAYREALLARRRLACPVTVVLAADDPVTAGREDRARLWGRFATGVEVVVADGGGHQLPTTRPELITGLVHRLGGTP